MPNRPLPRPRADRSGFSQAAQITARSGTVAADILNRSLLQASRNISIGLEGRKQRTHQEEMQARTLAAAEQRDAREMHVAMMRQKAMNARALIPIKAKELENIRERISEIEYSGQPVPAELRQRETMLTNDIGGYAARGAGLLNQANLGEHALGVAPGSISAAPYDWSTLLANKTKEEVGEVCETGD